MKNSWAISGVDLYLDLTGPRIRAALERALCEAVQSARLPPGTRLPSSRSLAADLGIARNSVADVYGQLVAEGWLTARQGSGTRVADRTVIETAAGSGAVGRRVTEGHEPRSGGAGRFIRPLRELQTGSTAAFALAARARYDLKPGTPDLSAFPRSEWLAAARRALTSAPNTALGYSEPHGLPVLRRAVARYVARARGVRAAAEQVVICSGYVQALALVSAALRTSGGRRLAVEALGLDVHREVIESVGLSTVPVPVDGAGACTDRLDGTAADAVLLTPAHQFPTGVALAPDRRTAVVEWAAETGGLIIEDDYDGEFRYDRQPVGALQALDPGRVVYIGTASKSLVPGLRIAWAVLPPDWVEPVAAGKRLADLHTGTFEQLTLAEFIESGAYDRHIRRSRLRYRRRRDRLVAALGERAPQVTVSGIAAGLHAVVDLPGGREAEQAVVARAARRGLRLEGLGRYCQADSAERRPALVVGYGTPPDHAFTGALDALCDSLVPPGRADRPRTERPSLRG